MRSIMVVLVVLMATPVVAQQAPTKDELLRAQIKALAQPLELPKAAPVVTAKAAPAPVPTPAKPKTALVTPANLNKPATPAGLKTLPRDIKVVPAGLYEITVPAEAMEGIKTGVLPALVLSGVDKQGRWKSKETVADIKQSGDGFQVRVPLNETMVVEETSFVMFDVGVGNLVQIPSDMLRDSKILKRGPIKVVPLQKQRYEALHGSFPTKPGAGKKVASFMWKVAVPTGVGFATLGPAGVVLPLAQNFVANKARQ